MHIIFNKSTVLAKFDLRFGKIIQHIYVISIFQFCDLVFAVRLLFCLKEDKLYGNQIRRVNT